MELILPLTLEKPNTINMQITTNATTTTTTRHQSFISKFDFEFYKTTVDIYGTIHQDE